jgi:hypothetical protein
VANLEFKKSVSVMAQFTIHKSKPVIFVRWCTSILILGILLWILYIFAGQVLCQIALKQIAELTNTKIKAESVNFNTEGSVIINDLTVSPRQSRNREASIIVARKVYARFNPVSLFLLHPRLKVIDVNDFVFNAQYDLDTGWSNLSELHIRPPENSFRKMPRLLLHNGTLQYSKIKAGQAEIAVSMPVDASFGPNNETSKGYDFEITTATMKSGFGQSHLKGSWKPGIVTVTGGISSSDVPELKMSWLIDVMVAEFKYDRSKDFSLKLRIKDLQSKRSESLDRLAMVGSSFLEKSGLFTALHNFFNRYQPRGHVDAELEAIGNWSQLRECTLTGWVDCRDVEILYSGFPYAVQHMVGRIDFTKNYVAFNHLTGRHGDVELSFNGWSRDFGPDHQSELRIKSETMPFDHDLYCALNAKQKKFWDQFSPVGDAAVDLHLSRQPQKESRTNLELDLHKVKAVYHDFPYPLKNLTGKIIFTNDKVTFTDVVSQENERLITLNGLIQTDESMYDMIVNIKNLAMDSTLEAVLPQNQKIFYQKLCPLGLINGGVRIFEMNKEPARYYADLYFKNASVYSEELSSFITDVSARAVFTPESVDVKRFSGLYGESPVSLTGQIRPVQEQQALYNLSLVLEQIQLNEDFFCLLPKSLKETVAGLKPAGKVNLDVDLNKSSLTKPPDYRITVHCQANDINLPNFSNPLKDITGTLIIDENNVELEDLAVSVGDINPAAGNIAVVKLNGKFSLNDGTLTEALVQLSSDKISFDERLKQILPQQARNLYDKLTPSGSFSLDFNDVRIRFGDNGQKSIDFAGRINLESCGLDLSGAGMQLKNFVLRTKGSYQTEGGLTRCQMTIDDGQLRIHGKSLTSLETDIAYDPNQQKWFTENFICDCYGGKTTGKLELKQSDDGSFGYVLQAAFDNIDLKQCLADTNLRHNGENAYTSGKMSGSLSVNTHVAGELSRIGSLRINIKDMKVGKLSPLGKLLQVLNLTEPSDFAFNRMFMDSYIRDKSLFIEKLDLSGQGFAFYGAGWMDLVGRNIKMTLTARGQRLATDDPSVLQSLTEGLGLAVIQMEVRGTLDEPVIKTKALPVIEGTLQILGKKPKASD